MKIGRSISTQIAAHAALTIGADGNVHKGDINLGANKLITTTCIIKEIASDILAIKNLADDEYRRLYLSQLGFETSLDANATGALLNPYNVDNAYMLFKARNSGVGLIEVARLVGAADPYFQATLPMVLTATARPGTPVAGHLVRNSTSGEPEIYDGANYLQFLRSASLVVNYDDTSPVTIATLPAGSIVLAVFVNITTAWTTAPMTFIVGIATDTDGFLEKEVVDSGVTGWKGSDTYANCGALLKNADGRTFYLCAAETAVQALFSTSAPQAGVAEVYILYVALAK